ncbi:hypothetical protein ACLBTR_21750, partial [Pseudomonas aeruginosa]
LPPARAFSLEFLHPVTWDLKAGWSEADVARELGMDNDEVLRFKQVSGLPELFREHVYSRSWE